MSTQYEKGQGLVEYALIIVLLAIACIIALTFLGDGIRDVLYNSILENL